MLIRLLIDMVKVICARNRKFALTLESVPTSSLVQAYALD